MNKKTVVKEIAPGQWVVAVVTGMGVSMGRSTFASAQEAGHAAVARDPDAQVEVQLRVEDERIPLALRRILRALLQHGHTQPGREITLPQAHLRAMGLDLDALQFLYDSQIPPLGGKALFMLKRNLPQPGDAQIQLTVALVA